MDTSQSVMALPDGKDLIVHGRACVPGIFHEINFTYSVNNIVNWVREGRANGDVCVMVSGGPSLKKREYLNSLKALRLKKSTVIVCVKHALPVLLDEGIIPDYCIVLDPRSMEGISTHGSKRKSLYEKALDYKDEITFLVATITDYKTTQYLLENGCKVIGWNCILQGNKHHHYIKPNIDYGSCAAIRGIQLFEILGFRQFILFGYDSSFDFEGRDPSQAEVKDKGLDFVRTKWDNGIEGSPGFWTKGELAVQAQEIVFLLQSRTDLLFVIMCDGFIGRCWNFLKKTIWKDDYREILSFSK